MALDYDTQAAASVAALAGDPGEIPSDAPCCAWCGGIEMDPTAPIENAAGVLHRKSACPISIVAYQAAIENARGSDVEIIPSRCGVPTLRIGGRVVDPLEHYGVERCGCGG